MENKFNKAMLLIIAIGVWAIVYQNYQSKNEIQKVNVENEVQKVKVTNLPYSPPPRQGERYY